jgi:flagellar assembly factor FliW
MLIFLGIYWKIKFHPKKQKQAYLLKVPEWSNIEIGKHSEMFFVCVLDIHPGKSSVSRNV